MNINRNVFMTDAEEKAFLRDIAHEIAWKLCLHDEISVNKWIEWETPGDKIKVSSAGARGLLQIKPESMLDVLSKKRYKDEIPAEYAHLTKLPPEIKKAIEEQAKALEEEPVYAIWGSMLYLKKQIDYFNDKVKGVAAYRLGPGRIEKYKKVPLTKEIITDIVKKIPGEAPPGKVIQYIEDVSKFKIPSEELIDESIRK